MLAVPYKNSTSFRLKSRLPHVKPGIQRLGAPIAGYSLPKRERKEHKYFWLTSSNLLLKCFVRVYGVLYTIHYSYSHDSVLRCTHSGSI
jgi:hypothetical protein